MPSDAWSVSAVSPTVEGGLTHVVVDDDEDDEKRLHFACQPTVPRQRKVQHLRYEVKEQIRYQHVSMRHLCDGADTQL